VAGLHSASPAVQDVFSVFGSSRRQRLVRSQLPAALPVVVTGLKVAMPLTIVGAVIGEWFGASKGIGPVLLVAVRNYKMPDMWAAAVVMVVIALILFGIMAIVERVTLRRFS
jgi:NitT/TauT family transport system permease protein